MCAVKTILLVEDDVSIREVLVEMISQETSYRTRVATDASQAIEITRKTHLDLWIMNYRLPGKMNGIELYDYLHQIPGHEQVPAMIISATLPEEDITTRHIIGIHKPFELDDLLEQIEKLFSLSRTGEN